MPVRRLPLSYYVGKLERREPFTYLSYGDGEFHAMAVRSGTRTMTNYEEVVTPEIAEEMRASLYVVEHERDGEIIRGTDEFIVEPDTYQGNDKHVIQEAHRVAMESIGDRKIDWVDGTVWDESVKNGMLGPLLKALINRVARYVGSPPGWTPYGDGLMGVPIPTKNCIRQLDAIESCIVGHYEKYLHSKYGRYENPVYTLCMGLGAMPLALRIRGKIPGATVIDLGSALDVFAGLGGDRGWRRELYADPARLKDLIDRNLEGV